MNTLVWKLLRQHISIGQLAGFFLANLFGMMIVLLSVQFYKDVIPVFTEGDSFMKKDFIIATKKISTLGSFAGKSNTFSPEDIADLKKQSFTKTIGAFIPSQFKVSAGLLTSMISRAGCASASGAKFLFAQFMKDCGTRIVFRRLEKPTMFPLYCSTRPLPRIMMSI